MSEIYVGTSGFSYKEWRLKFYPPGLPPREQLTFYARHFNTVEVNNTFYNTPARKTVQRWIEQTPVNFRLCLKVSRTISHDNRLANAATHIPPFMEAVQDAIPGKGVLLLQLPPSLGLSLGRLDEALSTFTRYGAGGCVAVECRHPGWYGDELNDLLDHHRAALVLHDMPGSEVWRSNPGAPFIYMRFHGPRGDYGGVYGTEKLEPAARILRARISEGRPVYAFFNHDKDGHAIEDTRLFRDLITPESAVDARTAAFLQPSSAYHRPYPDLFHNGGA